MQEINFESLRSQMIKRLESKGIKDGNLLAIMNELPRENFVPIQLATLSYDDTPLPVWHKHIVPHPWITAFNLQALKIKRSDKVLELGTNTGYQTSILAQLASLVISLESSLEMSITASLRVRGKGKNVRLYVGNLRRGLPQYAPYDVIISNAPFLEFPRAIAEQLAEGGRMIYSIRNDAGENIILLTRQNNEIITENLMKLNYLPLQELIKEKAQDSEIGQDDSEFGQDTPAKGQQDEIDEQ